LAERPPQKTESEKRVSADNAHEDQPTAEGDASGLLGITTADAHLLCVREALAGYAEAAGLTMAEILLPSMPESTRRHGSGRALLELLTAIDPPLGAEAVQVALGVKGVHKVEDGADLPVGFADLPFLVCTLHHPETGLRVAVLGAAVRVT
jgi:hypothetical protein